jgi:hypothetical protein
MIVGGTADYSTGLSSVDIYNPLTGCYNISNITYSRMNHTATYYNNSDIVILIGGVKQVGVLIQESELISTDGAELYQPIIHARYSHRAAILNNSNILVVAGLGPTNVSRQLEMYNGNLDVFQSLNLSNPQLRNLEGHSVTNLGSSGTALIFGGYNGTTYFRHDLIANGRTLTSAHQSGNNTGLISGRAYHQATYIPQINAVLITGGHNSTQTFSTCYLYYVGSKTFNTTGSMHQRRSFHAAVLLSNGSVLIIGGAMTVSGGHLSNPVNSVERYDFTTQSFTTVASLNVARYGHNAVILPTTNEVFVFGGIDTTGNILSSIEYLDPKSY